MEIHVEGCLISTGLNCPVVSTNIVLRSIIFFLRLKAYKKKFVLKVKVVKDKTDPGFCKVKIKNRKCQEAKYRGTGHILNHISHGLFSGLQCSVVFRKFVWFLQRMLRIS